MAHKGKSHQNKIDKFHRLYPEGRKRHSLIGKIKTTESNLIQMKEKLEKMK